MLKSHRFQHFVLLLIFAVACGVGYAQAGAGSTYDVQPTLIGNGIVGTAHCEVVQLAENDASHAKDIVAAASVGRQGLPMNVHLVHGIGTGLDEKAVMIVRQLRFKPAVKDGGVIATPVPVYIRVTFNDTPPQ